MAPWRPKVRRQPGHPTTATGNASAQGMQCRAPFCRAVRCGECWHAGAGAAGARAALRRCGDWGWGRAGARMAARMLFTAAHMSMSGLAPAHAGDYGLRTTECDARDAASLAKTARRTCISCGGAAMPERHASRPPAWLTRLP